MTEKRISLSSSKDFLSGSAFLSFEKNLATIIIDTRLNTELDENNVLRAYFVYENLETLNIGVMETKYNFSKLEKSLSCPDGMPWGILITNKDTITQNETIVATGYFFEGFNEPCDDTPKPIENAKNILSKIQNASETKDQGISKNNCINMIKKALCNLPSTNHTFRMFDTFYKVESFSPIVNLSSLKFLMFEGFCAYSFYESGHYLISLKDNFLFVAFMGYDGRNPLFHIEEFSLKFDFNSKTYFGVTIELSDEGQYFIV